MTQPHLVPSLDEREVPEPPRPLPAPGRERWQPLRIGLVDLFYYEVEEFWFRDGRLLLRGNNGTGKSKVLALALPFLLDGEMAAHRVEPDADPKKRMEWNLLLGGEHPHPERLGYTWVEFGRIGADGTAEFRTLGCGMKAVSGRGIARHWFFATDQRIGAVAEQSLELVDATRTALSRDRLAEAVEGRGRVYDRARDYRRAVDEALFGLGEQRYAALVDLLIQLRQPQLSKRPSEAALSRALTEALPPMDQAVIADVAEAFRSLDEEKDELAGMAEAEGAATAFLTHYRRYARVAARRRAALPRTENSRYERLRGEAAEAQEERDRAEAEVGEAERRLGELEERETRLKAEDEALRAGPEMRSARELEQAAKDAESTARQADSAARDRGGAAERLTRQRRRLDEAQRRRESAGRQLDAGLAEAAAAATRARIAPGHAEEVDAPLRADAAEENTVEGVQRAAAQLAERRARTLNHVDGLARRAEDAAAERTAAEERLSESEAEVSQAGERLSEAEQAAQEAGERLVADTLEHFTASAELRLPDPHGVLDRLGEWAARPEGPNPARAEAGAAAQAAGAALAAEQARLDVTRRERTEARAQLRAELAELESGGQRGPRSPYTRDPRAREGVPGAPLWRLVDFADGTSPERRAGLEAALEASGLLDAWVTPAGRALDAERHDVLASAGEPVSGTSLAQMLRPAVDHGDEQASAVSEAAVASLLAAIGYGAPTGHVGGPHTWVDAEGRFRVGALTGSWAKGAAEYLGEGAREEARRARIAAITGELAEVDAALEEVAAAAERLRVRRSVLDAELAGVPDDADVRSAHAALAEATGTLTRARQHREERAGKAQLAAEAAARAVEELAATAAEMGLPRDAEELREIRDGLAAYELALRSLWPAVRELSGAAAAVAAEQAEVDSSAEHAAELAERAEEAGHQATAAQQRHATLEATVGATVQELQRRLASVAGQLRECVVGQKRAREDHSAAVELRGEASGRIAQLERDIAEAADSRAKAVDALRRFTATGLLGVALPDLPDDTVPPGDGPWAPDPAVRLARAVERELTDTDAADAAWERVQKRITEELKNLQDALSPHGHTAHAEMSDDGIVVRVTFQGRERTVPDLADALGAEVAERQRILSARQREILENHLLTEVAGTLQELIGAAERQILGMNNELRDRPTSTGMQLRLVWRPSRDAPTGLAEARSRLLRQASDAWSPADRAVVGDFLQAQIDREKAKDPTGTWLEQLTRALDYRAWHEFGVERHQNGAWRSATGPASGGERVLSVSIPLFAAASSHYATAGNPHAPRLITLDEAFAGVDDDSRAKCLGLLHAFDLDVVMTSEREWGCYPQVPGLSIAQLSRVDGIDAVLVTRWEWDGRERRRGTDPEALDHRATDRQPESEEPAAAQDALWE